MSQHCKIHLTQLRKGSSTKPCRICGLGVWAVSELCRGCGELRAAQQLINIEHRARRYFKAVLEELESSKLPFKDLYDIDHTHSACLLCVVQLKATLRQYGLPVTGRKADLLQWLEKAVSAEVRKRWYRTIMGRLTGTKTSRPGRQSKELMVESA